MSKVILLADRRTDRPAPVAPPAAGQPALDRRARPLRDLRISVTDRCNFRCTYCMPREVFDTSYAFMRHSDLLSFEEITRLAGIFTRLGVEKIRLTGGEPLSLIHIWSDRISQPSPLGVRCAGSPFRKPRSMRLSGS